MSMNSRIIKIGFGAVISLYMAIVCFNNSTDYDANFQFVRMVSGMSDVFSREKTGWRAIHSETLHHLMYLFLIGVEFMIALLAGRGSFALLRKVKSASGEFNAAKKILATGLALGVMLWFGMFITVGGEWFLMWQSKNWNGQPTAFSLAICFLLFLIHLQQPDE